MSKSQSRQHGVKGPKKSAPAAPVPPAQPTFRWHRTQRYVGDKVGSKAGRK